jgi:apolipoprotein N-acyltransferase
MVTIIAALFYAASFEPLGKWFFAPISFALLFKVLRKSQRIYLRLFIFGFLSSVITLGWAGEYVGVLPLFFLALLHGLYFLPLGLIRRFSDNWLWYIPAILVLEELRARFPFAGFSWMRIAFSQSEAPYASVISIGGALLLSFWVLILASILAGSVPSKKLSLVIILAMVFLPSLIKNEYLETKSITYAAVQGNTPSIGLTFNDRARAVFDLHVKTTRKMVTPGPDVIIWPENAIDVDPFDNPDVALAIKSITAEYGVPLIAGAISRVSGQLENISVAYGKDGSVASLYSKQYLTPFGEYIPLRPIARIISPYVDGVADFYPGERQDLHLIKEMNLAPIICFEILSDSLMQKSAKISDAFVVQTNSATFANTAESAQQLAITRLRAIENSREIVSVSTIGISAHIDINGKILRQTKENISTSMTGTLRGNSENTLAGRFGGVAPILVVALATLFALRLRILRPL